MPRESSKTRKWEKERRDRLKESFTQLSKHLPSYDPSLTISKSEILHQATAHIQALQEKIKQLLDKKEPDSNQERIPIEIIKKLEERVKKLQIRNEQLHNLLKDAGITVPSVLGTVKKFKKPLSWSNKITAEQAKVLQKKEEEKQTDVTKPKIVKRSRSKFISTSISPIHRKALNRSKKLKRSKKQNSASNCVIVISRPSVTQSCYIITNAPSNNPIRTTSTVITNSRLFTSPIVSSNIKQTILTNTNPPLSSLGSGTLILANGTILPMVQAARPIPAPVIVANQLPKPTPIVVVPNAVTETQKAKTSEYPKKGTSKALPKIRPKICLTTTTQVNKVPIPALSSSYTNSYLLLKETAPKDKSKKTEVKEKAKPTASKQKPKESENPPKRQKLDNDPPPEIIKENSVNEAEALPETETEPPKEPLITSEIPSTECTFNEQETISNETVEKNTEKTCPENPEIPVNSSENLEETNIEPITFNTEPKAKETENECLEDNGMKSLELNLNPELSNDIFASLQVPTGCQNPESTSPTAAFLLAFPVVSNGVKVTEVIDEESQRGTPTLLQIGTMVNTKPTQTHSESLTPNLLNLDNFSFFPGKDCNNYFNLYQNPGKSKAVTSTTNSLSNVSSVGDKNDLIPPMPERTVPEVDKNISLLNPPNTVNHNEYPSQEKQKMKILDVNLYEQQKPHHNDQVLTSGSESFVKQKPDQAYDTIKHQKPTYNQRKSFAQSDFIQEPFYMTPSFNTPKTSNCNNSNNYNYSYDHSNQIQYKNKNESYYPSTYENVDCSKKDSISYSNNYYQNKYANKNVKPVQNKAPINWMTTPDNRQDYLLGSFGKENDLSQNTFYPSNSFMSTAQGFFNTSSSTMYTNSELNVDPKKTFDLPLGNYQQRNEIEDNHFPWSPTKAPQFLDSSHSFVSSTLPTLVGDLALGNSNYLDQKVQKDGRKDAKRKVGYENQSFLSVSQLVDHNKCEGVPARTTARRNSGSRTKSQAKKRPVKDQSKDPVQNFNNVKADVKANQAQIGNAMKMNNYVNQSNEMFCEQKSLKNNSSSYTAEALIGHMQTERKGGYSNSSKISIPPFLSDNIIPPYFPPVDLQQDNTYMQHNQNYQTSSFSTNFSTTFQNTTYNSNTFIPPVTTITTSYLPSNNFMHDVGTHDYMADNLLFTNPIGKDKFYNNKAKQSSREDKAFHFGNLKKAVKKKNHNENLPGFDIPFLSIPCSINSPLLPDDYHSHTSFLPPTAPYKNMNALYPKQNDGFNSGGLLPLPPVPVTRNNTQHPEISPVNAGSTSLTNFNLSAIFPEINKGALPDMYSDSRSKEVLPNPRIFNTTSNQVHFNNKPTFTFGSYNN